eukprot:TRINITY_DN3566_c0_g1_i1.p1 TRINITY_DN3566_c0_g1~~TRINITY_DN3566_c0_g1_i1.p1  ORF type:complete len:1389 (-),score=303.85 TRINITY_DN3566_c0_g1_i1:301-4467(-)
MDCDPEFVKDIDARAAKGDEACRAASKCLQAMRSVICAQGFGGSATAYFAASVTSLQKQLDSKDTASDQTTAALLLVVRKSIAAVPASVVQARLNEVVLALERIVKVPEKEELIRQALGCLAAAANLSYDANGRPNRKMLKPIFSFLADARFPVRHRAHLAATAILRRAKASGDQQTLEFASQHVAQMIANTRPDKKLIDDLPAKHAITFLKASAAEFSAEGLRAVGVALVGLPAQLGQHPCCTDAFEFLAALLRRDDAWTEESEMTDEEAKNHAELAAKLLAGLISVPTNLLNVAYIVGHVRALAAATAALTSAVSRGYTSPQTASEKVAAMSKMVALFSERDPTVVKNLIEECQRVLSAAGEGGDLAFLEEMPETCRSLLSYDRKSAWPRSLPVVAAALDGLDIVRTNHVAPEDLAAWSSARFERASKLVKELVHLRDKARPAELGVYGKGLLQCIRSAVCVFGPQRFLSVAPMELLEHPLADLAYETKSRSWLMLVLKDSCARSSLALFSEKMLPLASLLKARSKQAAESSHTLSRKFTQLMEQVWALLPSMCEEPLDMGAALLAEGGRLAKLLVAVLVNEPDLRDVVFIAIGRLCDTVLNPSTPLAEKLLEANRTCLRTLSGRVIPEMFSAYLKMHSEAEGQDESRTSNSRRLALEAMQNYAMVAEPAMIANFFKTVVARLLKATTEEDPSTPLSQSIPLADLANALIPHLPADSLEIAMKVFSPMLTGALAATEKKEPGSNTSVTSIAGALQKAAYRAVTKMLQHPSAAEEQHSEAGKVLGFWNVLRDARQTCMSPALKWRLAAIEALLNLMEKRLPPLLSNETVRKAYLDCLTAVLPEILLHLRDQSTSVRDAARECLRVAATTAFTSDMQTEIVTLLSAGLAGLTPYSKASALDALSRMVYENCTKLPGHLRDRLIRIVLLLLQDSDAQVWRATLKFTKVVVFVLPKEELVEHLAQIMKLFDSKHCFTCKMIVRKIVEKLAKVLSPELLTGAFPKAHLPLLQYVQRQLLRRQRPMAVRQNGGEGGEEEEQEAGEEEQVQRKRRGSKKDVRMADVEEDQPGPGQSWDSFQDGDDKDDGKEGAKKLEGEPRTGGAKKRTRGAGGGSVEPPTSGVMAHSSVQAMLDAWEEESDGSDGEGGQRRRRGGDSGKRKRDDVTASTWIHEEKDVPVDFMSADAAHAILTSRPPQKKRQKGDEIGNAGATNKIDALRRSGLTFSSDGRLVVEEPKDDDDKMGEDEGKENTFNIGTHSGDAKKPKALSKLAGMRLARQQARAKAKAEKKNSHTIKGLDSYKPGARKAEGDARRKGQKLEPYAYIRLNPKVTKEKFKGKATQSFSKVVKGAKQGVLKGLKAKARDSKLKKTKEGRKQRRSQANKTRGKRGTR